MIVKTADLLVLKTDNCLGHRDFPCRDGLMISFSDWCDDKFDCPTGEDEECPPSYICSFDQAHRCSDTGVCIPNNRMCNARCDCPNCEDEGWHECGFRSVVQYLPSYTNISFDSLPLTQSYW